jgi:DEAD/DEAH box helicase domain-containing protein
VPTPVDPTPEDRYDFQEVIAETGTECLHIEELPASAGVVAEWPEWINPDFIAALGNVGITQPWAHQVEFAESAHSGVHSILATGTASGKTIAFAAPALTSVASGATALYIAPTKSLAADQLATITGWNIPGIRAATLDGDTPRDDRQWIRSHANYILTNPDMLHFSVLPGHRHWAHFFRHLSYVIVDEAHIYRGVFGAHVALILRRLLRIAAKYGAQPTVLAASATTGDPELTLVKLIGQPSTAFTINTAARPQRTFYFWQPPEIPSEYSSGTARRGVLDETSRLLARIIPTNKQSVAFARSRKGVEYVSQKTQELVGEQFSNQVRAYRGGYLAHERRELEQDLRSGDIRAMAATNALELGIDITGLDVVITAGWPGTKASLWQQVGRAGRSGQDAVAIFIAREDPLDTYIAQHPEVFFDTGIEVSLAHPGNPFALAPHLCAAAQELPLTESDLLNYFPDNAPDVVLDLVDQGMLRRRPTGWYWTKNESAAALADLRGTGGEMIRVVEADTGRLCGYVDHAASHRTVHEGAVYIHQGEVFVVRDLELDSAVALVDAEDVDYTTYARDVSDIRIIDTELTRSLTPSVTISFGDVEVSSQTVAFTKRHISGENLGTFPLDLPVRVLRTKAVWWTFPSGHLPLAEIELAGAIHGAEHAGIGMLPLFASCDRWDIGGVSTVLHPDTECTTIFIYDALEGGAGIAEYGFHNADKWITATADAVATCTCTDGCPSCIQSPKCGNGNEPLDKRGAISVLTMLSEST